jgi:hypothetical protein
MFSIVPLKSVDSKETFINKQHKQIVEQQRSSVGQHRWWMIFRYSSRLKHQRGVMQST